MEFEIKFVRKMDIITGISEMIITWKKEQNNSFLTVECGKEKYDEKTEGDTEKKIIDLVQKINIHPFVKNEDDYIVLDGTDFSLSIKQGFFAVDITWHEMLPVEWEGVGDLIAYIKQISNAENICDQEKGSRNDKMRERIEEMPFTEESLISLLKIGAYLPTGVCHCDIADWCGRFAQFCRDEFDAGHFDYNHPMKQAEEIAEDVDVQWELFLDNTYSLEELNKIDLKSISLPKAWFFDWLKQLGIVP